MTLKFKRLLLLFLILKFCKDCETTNTTENTNFNVSTTEEITTSQLILENTTLQTTPTNTSTLDVATETTTVTSASTTTVIPETTIATTFQDSTTALTNTHIGNVTDELLTTETSTESLQLKTSSIIEILRNSEKTEMLLMSFNLTMDFFFNRVVNYTLDLSSTKKQALLNSSEGQLLLEIVQANEGKALGEYSGNLTSEQEQVFFYALLIDIEENLDDQSYIEDVFQAVVFANTTSSYSLNASRLAVQVCLIYTSAGGPASSCSTTALPIHITTSNPMPPVALIVGCTIGGGVLLVAIALIIRYICKKTPASKVTPSDDMTEISRPDSKNNCFCDESDVSTSRHSDSGL